ncbi:hypothetical protein HaLaN_17913 [Haematococcus lacustris]|uniref:Uncharacterized protein n=1 Tax=Haematococcus lacustris TaxID=44745 RepID=A0A699ZXP4_HAELA|nr:hypothetical protein HaLaN_17913 [Haematococcus lacustris]
MMHVLVHHETPVRKNRSRSWLRWLGRCVLALTASLRVVEGFCKKGLAAATVAAAIHPGWVGCQGRAAGLPQGGGEGQQRRADQQGARQGGDSG